MSLSPSRRRLLVAAVLVLAGGSGAVWYLTRPTPAPTATPPEVKAEGIDPSVAAAIGAARQKVLDDLRSAAAWGELGKLLLAHTFETEADVCFEQAAALDPDDGRWPYYRGLFAA